MPIVGDKRSRLGKTCSSTKITKRFTRAKKRRSSSKRRNRQGGVFEQLPLITLGRKLSNKQTKPLLNSKRQCYEGNSYTEIIYNREIRNKNSDIGLNNNCKTTLPKRKDIPKLETVSEKGIADDENIYLATEELNVADRFKEIKNDTWQQNKVFSNKEETDIDKRVIQTNTDIKHTQIARNADNTRDRISDNIYQNADNTVRRELSLGGYDLPPIRNVYGRDVNIGKLRVHLPYQARVKISRNELVVMEIDDATWKIAAGDGVNMFKSFSYVHSFHHGSLS